MNNNTPNIIRKMVVATIIAEYALIELKDQTKQDLKQRTNTAINSIRKVQDWFLHHPQHGSKYHNIFKNEFLSGKIILISELIETIWALEEEDLEEIINQIKKNIHATPTTEPTY